MKLTWTSGGDTLAVHLNAHSGICGGLPISTTTLFQAERDALASLGLFAGVYELFDVPVQFPGDSAPSHVNGLNIHALIIDNADGEVMALERNMIHSVGSPLEHGEQRALRSAMTRMLTKRPRAPNQSIEAYYRGSMFLAPGTTDADFLNLGATLYTTLEPCPLCASALLVCRMKRTCFLIPDTTFGGAWLSLKKTYPYQKDDTGYLPYTPVGGINVVLDKVTSLHQQVLEAATQARSKGVRDTHVLDFCRSLMEQAFELLQSLSDTDFADARNQRTLRDLKRLCGMAVR